jgi:hypothetical protein
VQPLLAEAKTKKSGSFFSQIEILFFNNAAMPEIFSGTVICRVLYLKKNVVILTDMQELIHFYI